MYIVVGMVLAIGLAIVWLSGFTTIQGPQLFAVETSIFLFGVGLFLTAATVVYFLWTFPGVVNRAEARMNVRLNQHLNVGHPGLYAEAPARQRIISLAPQPEAAMTGQAAHVTLPPFPAPTEGNAWVVAQPARRPKPPARKGRRRRLAGARTRRGRRSPADKRPILDIEGIGPTFSERLYKEGLVTIGDLRRAYPEDVADRVGAPITTMRGWQSMADLLEVDGVGPQQAELLVRSGIHSVEELAASRPATLLNQIRRTEAGRKVPIQKQPASLKRVQSWVRSASKKLGRSPRATKGARAARTVATHSH